MRTKSPDPTIASGPLAVPILLEEGEALIDAAQQGSSAARQVRATLEISVQPASATELSREPLVGGLPFQKLEPSTDLDGPRLT
jgi:hypothetical protein